ncbi:MAG TPA: type III pantothenate kinase, partial [Aggregatilineales bacterium]|nr:type III pantothenate kinase [Aggregatilineales bacterium]
MLLAIDIGNTNIHIGLWQGEWRLRWRLQTLPQKTTDEYAVLLHGLLHLEKLEFEAIREIAIASVVPALTRTFDTIARQYFRIDPLIITAATPMNLKIDLDTPEQVGADRIANALAAKELFGMPSIVFDFGTATNCEVISSDGVFIGGTIT